MQEQMGPYIDAEGPDTPYRAMIRQVATELAATSHGSDYWAFLRTCEKYQVKPVKDMPHCLDSMVPDPIHGTTRPTRLAILPGQFAWVVELPENHRPAICCKRCNTRDLGAELSGPATLSTTKPRAPDPSPPVSQNHPPPWPFRHAPACVPPLCGGTQGRSMAATAPPVDSH